MSMENATNELYESALGNLTEQRFQELKLMNCSLSDQLEKAAEGTGLAFVVFTQAIVELPWAPFWAVIFFLMLLSLGLGSQIGILEGMLCTVFDIEIFKRIRKPYVTGFVCLVCFLIGLIFTTGAGEYWLKMFDSFAGTIGLVVVAFTEMIAVVYVYGCDKFTKDIQDMTGYRPGWFWQICWRFLAPLIMLVILISSLVVMFIEHPKYSAWSAEYGKTIPTDFPGWALAVAAMMVLAGVLPIPVVFLMRRYQCLKIDINIHEGSIRRIDTTVSTKEMMTDVDMDDNDDRLPEYHDESDSDDDTNDNRGRLSKAFRMEVMDDY